jgi:MSHA biogenesis protein MshJ
MKQEWQKYAAKIDAMSVRERVAVFGALVLVIFYVVFMLLVDPALARRKAALAAAAQQRGEIQAIQTQIAALEAKRVDPDAPNLARRASVRNQLTEVDLELNEMRQNLVPAQNMKALLQEMLTHQPRLQVLALRTLPVTLLVDRPAKTDSAEKSGKADAPAAPKPAGTDENVFKHGVEITLQGSYADLYEYLTRVEKSRWRMFWSRASLGTESHPRLKLTITIYTLSLDKAWLVV